MTSPQFPPLPLTDLISTLWTPAGLALNRPIRPHNDPTHPAATVPERRKRKIIAALQNRGYGLQRAAETISDDEAQMERQYHDIRNFGYSWMIPTGRQTSQEDEADAFLDPAEHDEASPGPRPTMIHPLVGAAARPRETQTTNEEEPDLDADVEDLDEPAEASNDTSQGNDSTRDQENEGDDGGGGDTTEEE